MWLKLGTVGSEEDTYALEIEGAGCIVRRGSKDAGTMVWVPGVRVDQDPTKTYRKLVALKRTGEASFYDEGF